jgi:hypothetical protein
MQRTWGPGDRAILLRLAAILMATRGWRLWGTFYRLTQGGEGGQAGVIIVQVIA